MHLSLGAIHVESSLDALHGKPLKQRAVACELSRAAMHLLSLQAQL